VRKAGVELAHGFRELLRFSDVFLCVLTGFVSVLNGCVVFGVYLGFNFMVTGHSWAEGHTRYPHSGGCGLRFEFGYYRGF
jgi:hypothetical protein